MAYTYRDAIKTIYNYLDIDLNCPLCQGHFELV